MRFRYPRACAAVFLAAPAFLLPPPAAAQKPPSLPAGVVATVDGQPIRQAEVEDRLWREWGMVYTDYAVRSAIVHDEAKKRGITVTPQEVDEAVTEYRNRFNSVPGRQPRDWELFLQRFGERNVRDRQRDELLSQKIGEDVAAKTTLTADEKQRVLDDLKRAAHKVHVRHILVGYGAEYENRTEAQAKTLADEVKAKLEGGLSWEDAAKQYTDDVATRANGGDLGFVTRDQLVKPLEDAAFASADDTKTIHIVAVPSGFDVFQVLAREDKPPTEEETRKALDETLARKRDIVKQPNYWFPLVAKSYKTETELPWQRPDAPR